jgi:hypothetical protein
MVLAWARAAAGVPIRAAMNVIPIAKALTSTTPPFSASESFARRGLQKTREDIPDLPTLEGSARKIPSFQSTVRVR